MPSMYHGGKPTPALLFFLPNHGEAGNCRIDKKRRILGLFPRSLGTRSGPPIFLEHKNGEEKLNLFDKYSDLLSILKIRDAEKPSAGREEPKKSLRN